MVNQKPNWAQNPCLWFPAPQTLELKGTQRLMDKMEVTQLKQSTGELHGSRGQEGAGGPLTGEKQGCRQEPGLSVHCYSLPLTLGPPRHCVLSKASGLPEFSATAKSRWLWDSVWEGITCRCQLTLDDILRVIPCSLLKQHIPRWPTL